jgi:hypothetical protein
LEINLKKCGDEKTTLDRKIGVNSWKNYGLKYLGLIRKKLCY